MAEGEGIARHPPHRAVVAGGKGTAVALQPALGGAEGPAEVAPPQRGDQGKTAEEGPDGGKVHLRRHRFSAQSHHRLAQHNDQHQRMTLRKWVGLMRKALLPTIKAPPISTATARVHRAIRAVGGRKDPTSTISGAMAALRV